jgi:hypothetical protein
MNRLFFFRIINEFSILCVLDGYFSRERLLYNVKNVKIYSRDGLFLKLSDFIKFSSVDIVFRFRYILVHSSTTI